MADIGYVVFSDSTTTPYDDFNTAVTAALADPGAVFHVTGALSAGVYAKGVTTIFEGGSSANIIGGARNATAPGTNITLSAGTYSGTAVVVGGNGTNANCGSLSCTVTGTASITNSLFVGGWGAGVHDTDSTVTVSGGGSVTRLYASTYQGQLDEADILVTGNGYVGTYFAAGSSGTVGYATLTVSGGSVNALNAGSASKIDAVIEQSSVIITGGYVGGIYGGHSYNTATTFSSELKKSAITISGGTVSGEIYLGSSVGTKVTADTSKLDAVEFRLEENGYLKNAVYGGNNTSAAHIGDVTITLAGGTLDTAGSAIVYGTGKTADVTQGNVTINVAGLDAPNKYVYGSHRSNAAKVTLNVSAGSLDMLCGGDGATGSAAAAATSVTYTDGVDINVTGGTVLRLSGVTFYKTTLNTTNNGVAIAISGGSIGGTASKSLLAGVSVSSADTVLNGDMTMTIGGSAAIGNGTYACHVQGVGRGTANGDVSVAVAGGAVYGTVYGIGDNANGHAETASVLISGGAVTGDVYGTGTGTLLAGGTASVAVSGGEIGGSVYGLGAGVATGASLTLSGGSVSGDVCGVGGGTVSNSAFTITGGSVAGDVCGVGGGTVSSSTFTLSGGTVAGNVYGLGSGIANGSLLTINGTAVIQGDVYGVGISIGQMTGAANTTISGGTIRGSVYALGFGSADLYVAPEARGAGDGSSAENAAKWTNDLFWANAQRLVTRNDVTVHFAAGTYEAYKHSGESDYLRLSGIGSDAHTLTLLGAENDGTVIIRDPSDTIDPDEDSNRLSLMILQDCSNVVIDDLHFTGPATIGYGLAIRASDDVTVRNCSWIDMTGVYYAATGASNGSSDVVWENCRFDNIGYDSHAHHIYNANGTDGLVIRDCFFRDSYGDYIRFRNQCLNSTVENCQFEATGRYVGRPFIAFPLFNDKDPAEYPDPADHEYFSQGLTVRNCSFTGQGRPEDSRQYMLMYHQSGYNPVGEEYLISQSEAAAWNAMSVDDARAWMLDRLDIDIAGIEWANNQGTGVAGIAVYEAYPANGAQAEYPASQYTTFTDISRLMNVQQEPTGALPEELPGIDGTLSITGGVIAGSVYGLGSGSAGSDSQVLISGGTIAGDVCGKGVEVAISGGTVGGAVFGVGGSAAVDGDASVTISGTARVAGKVYGGGAAGTEVAGTASVSITGGVFAANTRVFGGGALAADGDSDTYRQQTEVSLANATVQRLTGGSEVSGGTYSLTGDTTATLAGGTVSQALVGRATVYGGATVTDGDEDTVSLVGISGGYAYIAAGAGMVSAANTRYTYDGDTFISLSGGTVDYLFGGNVGSQKTFCAGTGMNGDVSITVDTSVNTVTLKYLYAGSNSSTGYEAAQNGSTTVIFTGLGSNLIWSEGGISGDGSAKLGDIDKTRYTRRLVFDDFTGAFGAPTISRFDVMTFADGSDVTFTGSVLKLNSVSTWDFALGTKLTLTGNDTNSFAGDTLILGAAGDSITTDWVVMKGASNKVFAGWDTAAVTLFGVALTDYDDGIWSSPSSAYTAAWDDGERAIVVSLANA